MKWFIFFLGMTIGSFGNQIVNDLLSPARAEMAPPPEAVQVVEAKPDINELIKLMRLPIEPRKDEIAELIWGLK